MGLAVLRYLPNLLHSILLYPSATTILIGNMNSWVSKIWLRPSGVIVGLAGLVALQDGFFEIASVKGPSMSPTLSPAFHETGARDLVLLSKWTLKWNAKLERGQIVGFRPPHNPDKVSIKRIIALEGDIVFPQVRQAPSQRYPEQEVVVPKGHVWVEGDNWRLTKDSNDYGPVSTTS